MREILFVIGTLQVGGSELHLCAVANELRRRGWPVAICSLSGDGPLKARVQATGATLLLPPVSRGGHMNPFVRFSKLAITAGYLLAIFLRRRPAIVHFFLPRAYLMGAPLAVLARLPIKVMSRRSLNYYQDAHPVLRRAERLAHKWMTAVLGNSRSVVAELAAEGVPASRLGTIYNGIDIARFEPRTSKSELRRALQLPQDAQIYTMIANLIPYKGHADLLRAFAIAAPSIDATWRLLIVGRDDGIGSALKQVAVELGIGDKVEFLGLRTDVADILNASDVGLSASHEEGFSNAVLEAMACGLPMIATSVGGNPEAVAHGETGLIVPPLDAEALAGAIVQLAGDAALRKRWGRAGRARVMAHFTIDACVAQYEALYCALLSGQEPGDVAGLGAANRPILETESATR
ncbi:MAG: glycosyltransferase [Pseudolabrys sp.]